LQENKIIFDHPLLLHSYVTTQDIPNQEKEHHSYFSLTTSFQCLLGKASCIVTESHLGKNYLRHEKTIN